MQKQPKIRERYSVSLKYNPTIPEPGKSSLITIQITENQTKKKSKRV